MSRQQRLTLIATILGSTIVFLDSTVINVALPSIAEGLDAGLAGQQWVVEIYMLTMVSLLLVGGSLGDQFGRRRMFIWGLVGFGATSALCAASPSVEFLVAARGLQGVAGALLVPGSLAIVAATFEGEARGKAVGTWTAWTGIATVFGPAGGGALIGVTSWRAIFWINLPLIVGTIWLCLHAVEESRDPDAFRGIDWVGIALSAAGLGGPVFALIEQPTRGWGDPLVLGTFVGGIVCFALFVLWELHTKEPMLPMRFFQNRVFALANVASLLMFFGMFGSIFLLAQFFQTVQGYSPLQAGLRVLPWTAMPIFVAPIAGALSDRIGGRPLMATGLALQAIGLAWIAFVSTPTVAYSELVTPFVLSGIGMALYFAPVANVVLSAVRPIEEGQASGANNAIRELGGVFGVAVLASVFAHYGGYATGQTFVDGLTPAIYVGAVLVAAGALAALGIQRKRQPQEQEAAQPALEAA